MVDGFPYEDIISLGRPANGRHKPMPVSNRAAQFAPFAALAGYDKAIAETARITVDKADLSAECNQRLSRKLAYAMSLPGKPRVKITYFQPDSRKRGGAYVDAVGSIKRLEPADNRIILTDGRQIPFDTVSDITGKIFNDIEL